MLTPARASPRLDGLGGCRATPLTGMVGLAAVIGAGVAAPMVTAALPITPGDEIQLVRERFYFT